jgi:hypothetical protein
MVNDVDYTRIFALALHDWSVRAAGAAAAPGHGISPSRRYLGDPLVMPRSGGPGSQAQTAASDGGGVNPAPPLVKEGRSLKNAMILGPFAVIKTGNLALAGRKHERADDPKSGYAEPRGRSRV